MKILILVLLLALYGIDRTKGEDSGSDTNASTTARPDNTPGPASKNKVEVLKCKIRRLKTIIKFEETMNGYNKTFKDSWKQLLKTCRNEIHSAKQKCFKVQKNVSFNLKSCKPYLKTAFLFCKKEKYALKYDHFSKFINVLSAFILKNEEIKKECLKYL